MANSNSAIGWTDATWNPVVGCEAVSPGCEHCYAMTLHNRRYLSWKRGTFPTAPKQYREPFKTVQLMPERLDWPLHRKKPLKIFVNSLSDLFHEDVPDEFVAAVFAVMAATPHHTYQILTKRPERMRQWFAKVEEWADVAREVFGDDTKDWRRWRCLVGAAIRQTGSGRLSGACSGPTPWPLPNVWLGVSVEDQRRADERIPLLIQTPAAVRFLSCEPLLDEIDLDQWLDVNHQVWVEMPEPHSQDGWHLAPHPVTRIVDWYPGINWVIVGGESGPDFRPMDLDWARSLRDQCEAAGVPFFYKQGSALRPGQNRILDGRTWDEFPEARNV